jgi:predicted RNase H-like HicB family nuclease
VASSPKRENNPEGTAPFSLLQSLQANADTHPYICLDLQLMRSVSCSIVEIMQRTFTAVIHREDVWYVAECPEVGTASQGETIEEAVANLQEATELYLAEFPLKESPRPILTTFEVAVNV